MLYVYQHHAGYWKVFFWGVFLVTLPMDSRPKWPALKLTALRKLPTEMLNAEENGGAILVWYQMERLIAFPCFCGYLGKGSALDRMEMIRLSVYSYLGILGFSYFQLGILYIFLVLNKTRRPGNLGNSDSGASCKTSGSIRITGTTFGYVGCQPRVPKGCCV